MDQDQINPILDEWTLPFSMPDYSKIQDKHFLPALELAIKKAESELNDIINNNEYPTFENTLLALEAMGSDLDKVYSVFFSISSTCSTPEREIIAMEVSKKYSAFESSLLSNEALFNRIKTVREATHNLDPIQKRLVDIKYQDFIRGGAALTPDNKSRLAEIMSRLSELGTRFAQTVVDDEREWFMELDDQAVNELPHYIQNICRSAGEERDKEYIVTLSRSIIVPFLQFSPNRELRKKAYLAWVSRGEITEEKLANTDPDKIKDKDNVQRVNEILALREERARILGFENFSKYKLDTEMAKNPETVRNLLMQVWQPALKAAYADAKVLESLLLADGYIDDLQAWDWYYYSEQRRKNEHDLDELEIKPYFQLENIIKAAFDCANRLFALEFRAVKVEAWHEDCRAWEITRNGTHMALFIADYFARPGKFPGAWCTSILEQKGLIGEDNSRRPQVINVCNFAKGTNGSPPLLSYDDAITLFHEFGHALHHILSNVKYPSLAGLRVERDFVELPSQLYEHWLSVPEVLDRFARHVTTDQQIPTDLRDKLLAAGNYDAGFSTIEVLATAIVDLELHDMSAPVDALAEQKKILDSLNMPSQIRMRHATPHLIHAFSDDYYSSAYYSYIWAEVMDADAFDAFEDPFDKLTAEKLENEILSRGATRPASEHYISFRGRMPGVEPLLRGRGLL